jgi:hypothetical protein
MSGYELSFLSWINSYNVYKNNSNPSFGSSNNNSHTTLPFLEQLVTSKKQLQYICYRNLMCTTSFTDHIQYMLHLSTLTACTHLRLPVYVYLSLVPPNLSLAIINLLGTRQTQNKLKPFRCLNEYNLQSFVQ